MKEGSKHHYRILKPWWLLVISVHRIWFLVEDPSGRVPIPRWILNGRLESWARPVKCHQTSTEGSAKWLCLHGKESDCHMGPRGWSQDTCYFLLPPCSVLGSMAQSRTLLGPRLGQDSAIRTLGTPPIVLPESKPEWVKGCITHFVW